MIIFMFLILVILMIQMFRMKICRFIVSMILIIKMFIIIVHMFTMKNTIIILHVMYIRWGIVVQKKYNPLAPLLKLRALPAVHAAIIGIIQVFINVIGMFTMISLNAMIKYYVLNTRPGAVVQKKYNPSASFSSSFHYKMFMLVNRLYLQCELSYAC